MIKSKSKNIMVCLICNNKLSDYYDILVHQANGQTFYGTDLNMAGEHPISLQSKKICKICATALASTVCKLDPESVGLCLDKMIDARNL